MRLLEIILPKTDIAEIKKIMDDERVIEDWPVESKGNSSVIKILTKDDYAKELLNELEKKKDYRVVIYAIEGTLPKLDEGNGSKEEKIKVGKFTTISKEELYDDIADPVRLSANFILMVVLSSFVAGIGILKDNTAIVIGAMVIAPFLGPNMSMAFGTTLGDLSIIKKSILTGLSATGIALAISMTWGYFATNVEDITVDPDIEYQDLMLALMCGFAGVISVVSGQGSTLVGVMVAAALLPPLMRSGLLLGGGYYGNAFNSFLIFSANVVCVNIAGIITFYLSGIRPGNWWEKEKAKIHTRRAFVIWSIALVVLIVAVVLLRHFR